jgi:hypothetical protein
MASVSQSVCKLDSIFAKPIERDQDEVIYTQHCYTDAFTSTDLLYTNCDRKLEGE